MAASQRKIEDIRIPPGIADRTRRSVKPIRINYQRETSTVVVWVFCNASPSAQISRKMVFDAFAPTLNDLDSCQIVWLLSIQTENPRF